MTLKENKKHTKHTKLIKPIGGEFHTNEWALLGAPCSIINDFASKLASELSKSLRLGYIDASHQEIHQEHPFSVYYQDKQAYSHIESTVEFAQKQNKKYFSSLDMLLVNGNHFQGDKQIVFINERKKESLSRKLDRLTDLRVIVLENKDQQLHDFIKPFRSEKVSILDITEIDKLVGIILEDARGYIPKLNGLVLAGGKSVRMGYDKGTINYHGKAQREHEADILSNFCEKVFFSFSEKQEVLGTEAYPVIKDTFTGLGPYGAILSAFRVFPNQAWISLACDLPMMDNDALKMLIENRNSSKLATCFHNPKTKFPEPLITIWEPRAYPVLLEFLSQGYSCPRKVLINSEIEEIHVGDNYFMENVNDQETYHTIKKKLKLL